MRNGKQRPRLSRQAVEKAVLLGADKPKRIRLVYQCTECQIKLKTSHIIPESKAPEGLEGMLIPSICVKCLEKKIAGQGDADAP